MGGDLAMDPHSFLEDEVGAARYDLEVPGAGTVEFTVDVLGGPTDITGYTGSMQIRELRADAAPLATIDPSSFTVNQSTRQVTVRIPSNVTEAWTWERGVYDVFITGPSDDAWRIAEGRVTNSFAVTRS